MNKFTHNNGAYFKSNGANIYYEITGTTDGIPILFLHGGMLNIESFNHLLSFLPESYMYIGMDTRGHGASTFDGNLSYKILCEDVEQLLLHLNIKKIDIIGHSDGGTVAMKLAIANPHLVNSLVLIGAQHCLDETDPAIEMYESITPELWEHEFKKDVEYYNEINREPNLGKIISAIKTMWLDRSADSYPNEAIKNVTCDSLVIHGDDDFLVSRKQITQLADILKKSHFSNIPFSNHSVHEEKPDVVASLIKEFYEKSGKNNESQYSSENSEGM
ncbi:alpha/beta fold hydrolase [Serratia marcescens]|nr:alpha/beta hydrolase [Salmonella enterica]EJA3688848.1 alpha/beta hydrolase [Salmonella enterica]ELZ5534001.1 alpha/beta hydrolase [Escherichia coli]EMB4125783.1 alpha/beta hydrolase [Serratia marcescens]